MSLKRRKALKALGNAHTAVAVGPRSWSARLVSSVGALALATALLVAPSGAQAHDHDASQIPSIVPELSSITQEPINWTTPAQAAINLPFVELGAMDSRPGENKEAFLLRVGKVLDTFTTMTRHEACSAIMENADQNAWRVRLITNRSQMACARIIFEENGFSPTAETIHSHPRPKRFEGTISLRANQMDQRIAGRFCGNRFSLDDAGFSDGDKKNGPGYLVARGKLLYRDGTGADARIVGDIDVIKEVSPLVVGGAVGLPRTQEGVHAATAVWSREDVKGVPSTRCRRP